MGYKGKRQAELYGIYTELEMCPCVLDIAGTYCRINTIKGSLMFLIFLFDLTCARLLNRNAPGTRQTLFTGHRIVKQT